MDKKEKIKLGSGKTINETFLASSFCITDALANAYEYNGKQYCNINISILTEADKFGKNVKITLNDFKPTKKSESVPAINTKDDLPF